MDVSRFKQCMLWLVVIACVAGCATAAPVAGTATPPAPTATSTLLPTAPTTVAARGIATGTPLTDGAIAADATVTPEPGRVSSSAPTRTSKLGPTSPPPATAPTTLPDYWPTDGWRASTAEDQGVDSAKLSAMIDAINDQQLDIHSVLVIRNGYIIAETYLPPYRSHTRHQIYSVTKSFISALVGIAIEQGFIDGVGGQIIDFFPEREFANQDGRKAAMTLEHLLTMTTGLDWEEGLPTYQEMGRTKDWVRYILDKPMAAEPGQQFNYCSGCSHVLSAIIQETTGIGTREFSEQHLFAPLGIYRLDWGTDGSGIPNGGWGLEITPRDMAKLGYLYLNEGVWDGQQIVPAEWVRASVSERLNVDRDWSYGYQWWVDPSSAAYAAMGLAGQLVYVIPELDMVVVFTAAVDDHSVLFELIDDFIVPSVTSAP